MLSPYDTRSISVSVLMAHRILHLNVCSCPGLADVMECGPKHLYGVVVVLASFFTQLCASWILHCIGVFYVMFMEHIQGQRGTLALVSSLTTAFFLGIGKPCLYHVTLSVLSVSREWGAVAYFHTSNRLVVN